MHRAAALVLRGASTAMMSVGVTALLVTTACYTYDARSPGEIPPGQHVVVTVNNVGRVALTADIGDDVASVTGDLGSVDSAGIHMRVTDAEFLSGTSTRMAGVAVTVPTNGVVLVTTKQFSRSKTAAVVIGVAAALIAAIRAFGIIGSGNGDAVNKPVPPPGTT